MHVKRYTHYYAYMDLHIEQAAAWYEQNAQFKCGSTENLLRLQNNMHLYRPIHVMC